MSRFHGHADNMQALIKQKGSEAQLLTNFIHLPAFA